MLWHLTWRACNDGKLAWAGEPVVAVAEREQWRFRPRRGRPWKLELARCTVSGYSIGGGGGALCPGLPAAMASGRPRTRSFQGSGQCLCRGHWCPDHCPDVSPGCGIGGFVFRAYGATFAADHGGPAVAGGGSSGGGPAVGIAELLAAILRSR